jgi:hypothetical protein
LANDAQPTGAERCADRDLATARGGTSEQQVRDVRACNQEDQNDGPEENEQRWSNLPGEIRLQRHDGDRIKVRVRIGILLRETREDGARFRLRLRNRDVCLQAPDDADEVIAALVEVPGHGWLKRQEVIDRVAIDWELPARRHDADDCVRLRGERDLPAEDFSITAKRALPCSMPEHHDRRSGGLVFLRSVGATEQRLDPQHIEDLGRDRHAGELLRLVALVQHRTRARESRERGEALRLLAQVCVIRERVVVPDLAFARRAAPHHHEPIGIREWQRAQKHRVDDAEDRGVRTNPERERQDRNDGEGRCFDQHPEGVFEVV